MSQPTRLATPGPGLLAIAQHTVISVGLYITFIWGLTPLCAQTAAQQVPAQPSAEAPQTLEPVVVTGRADDLIGVAGSASEGRVGHAQLQTRPLLRPGEVLEVVPGVAVTQHSGTGKANQYFLRGFNLDHGSSRAPRAAQQPCWRVPGPGGARRRAVWTRAAGWGLVKMLHQTGYGRKSIHTVPPLNNVAPLPPWVGGKSVVAGDVPIRYTWHEHLL